LKKIGEDRIAFRWRFIVLPAAGRPRYIVHFHCRLFVVTTIFFCIIEALKPFIKLFLCLLGFI